MSAELLLSFSFIVVLAAILPGPNYVIITSNAIRYGKKAGFITILGTLTAFYAHGFFSIIGVSALILSSAKAFAILKLVGVLYLLYLGITLLIQAFNNKTTDLNTLAMPKIASASHRRIWTQGFVVNLLNPKVSMFYIAIFPQFLSANSDIIFTTLFLVTLQMLIVGAWFCSVVIVTHKFNTGSSPTKLRIIKAILGTVMLLFSFNLAQAEVRP